MHDAVSRHVHHSRAHHGSHRHAYRGHDENGTKLCHLCADGRIEEVDGIVADAHKEVEHRQHEQEDHDDKIDVFHVLFLLLFVLTFL